MNIQLFTYVDKTASSSRGVCRVHTRQPDRSDADDIRQTRTHGESRRAADGGDEIGRVRIAHLSVHRPLHQRHGASSGIGLGTVAPRYTLGFFGGVRIASYGRYHPTVDTILL